MVLSTIVWSNGDQVGADPVNTDSSRHRKGDNQRKQRHSKHHGKGRATLSRLLFPIARSQLGVAQGYEAGAQRRKPGKQRNHPQPVDIAEAVPRIFQQGPISKPEVLLHAQHLLIIFVRRPVFPGGVVQFGNGGLDVCLVIFQHHQSAQFPIISGHILGRHLVGILNEVAVVICLHGDGLRAALTTAEGSDSVVNGE